MKSRIQLSSAKNYLLGFATSALFLVSGLYYFSAKKTPEPFPENFPEKSTYANTVRQKFDPNTLSEAEWEQLGFSPRQVQTIFKYKSVVGGQFTSKQQLKKCYVISNEKFKELEPLLLLPEYAEDKNAPSQYKNTTYPQRQNFSYSSSYDNNKGLTIPGKFNPDFYGVDDFIRMGFSERQALSILKYKNYLGGSFVSKEKFKACYIISDENYQKLAPYLLLPEKTPENFSPQRSFSTTPSATEKKQIKYEPFDPNVTDLEGWKNLGFSEKQAQVIINYRDRNLKGSFKNLEEIARCFVISGEKFEELKPFIVLNPANIKSTNYNSGNSTTNFKQNITSTSKTDFSSVNLNEISFKQLIEFGFDERSAASFIGFRNKLGGFLSKNQILETYNIDQAVAQKLVDSAPLKTDNIVKYALMDAPEDWLKNHPYFKYYADKIIYYRITYSDEKKFFRTMKIKPEVEQKMRMYLK